ncbi:hypothetical protein GCM10009413_23050 [Tatumella punctata]
MQQVRLLPTLTNHATSSITNHSPDINSMIKIIFYSGILAADGVNSLIRKSSTLYLIKSVTQLY